MAPKLLLAAAVILHAQAPAERPRFEVASIKPDAPGGISTGSFQFLPGGRFTARQVLLRFFIQNAYGIRPVQISGAPDWINSAGYDIEAQAEGDRNAGQMQQMIQTLLEDRFKLRTHREVKDLPVYALTVAKGGHKLPAPKEENCVSAADEGTVLPTGPTTPPRCGRAMVTIGRFSGVEIRGAKIQMAELIRILSNILGRTVIDKTDSQSPFDVRLSFGLDDAIDGLPRPPGPPNSRDAAPLSVFVAIQEQLGLKLESTKGPVEVLVIDHIEPPSAN